MTNVSCAQYDNYVTTAPKISKTAGKTAAVSQAPPVEQVVPAAGGGEQKPIQDNNDDFFKNADISDAPIPPGQRLVKREERIEYRDQDGNVLDEEQVKALEGKVEFKTRYETRTRMVDGGGNEVEVPINEAGVAPPHPDVEGVDSQTFQKRGAGDESVPPAKESIEGDHEAKAKKPKPASEKNEASAS